MATKTELETTTRTEIEESDKRAELDPQHLEIILDDLAQLQMYIESKIGRVKKISDPRMQIQEAFGSLDVICAMARATESKVCRIKEEFEADTSSGGGEDQMYVSFSASRPASSMNRY